MTWTDLLTQTGSDVRLFEAVAAEDAATVGDAVTVVVPAFDSEQRFGPAPWMPRVDAGGNTVLINRGDRCIIGLGETEDEGQPEVWIIAWWPF